MCAFRPTSTCSSYKNEKSFSWQVLRDYQEEASKDGHWKKVVTKKPCSGPSIGAPFAIVRLSPPQVTIIAPRDSTHNNDEVELVAISPTTSRAMSLGCLASTLLVGALERMMMTQLSWLWWAESSWRTSEHRMSITHITDGDRWAIRSISVWKTLHCMILKLLRNWWN